MKRGRPSVGDLTLKPGWQAVYLLQPPRGLTVTEQATFREVVASVPPGHFAAADQQLLATYAQATAMVRLTCAAARKNPELIGAWEKACRVQMAAATKLRLTVASRLDAQTAARRTVNHNVSAYDLREWETQ